MKNDPRIRVLCKDAGFYMRKVKFIAGWFPAYVVQAEVEKQVAGD